MVRAPVEIGPAGGQDTRPVTAEVPAPGRRAARAVDLTAIPRQLGRVRRGLLSVAHRCPCGLPDVVQTAPRLPDGTPFPTLYYLTCPRAVAAVSRLEAGGLMREMRKRLDAEPGLRQACLAAHRDYLARREEAAPAPGVQPPPPGTPSARGMPGPVKCLHGPLPHAPPAPGVRPLGPAAAPA